MIYEATEEWIDDKQECEKVPNCVMLYRFISAVYVTNVIE